jgi:glutamate-ammonia-ligase adenylyltransferase
MRLRPSGNQGPVAVSRAAFIRYHKADSWTWERMALTRARIMAATGQFAQTLQSDITAALTRKVPAAAIKADTSAMLARIIHDLPPTGLWDVKHCPGGMIELAFIAEALQLIHAPAEPNLLRPNTIAALRALQAAGHLSETDSTRLIAADTLWRTIQGIARITGMRDRDEAPPPAMLAPLLRATATIDLAQLRFTMAQHQTDVREIFTRLIGPITTGETTK